MSLPTSHKNAIRVYAFIWNMYFLLEQKERTPEVNQQFKQWDRILDDMLEHIKPHTKRHGILHWNEYSDQQKQSITRTLKVIQKKYHITKEQLQSVQEEDIEEYV